MIVITSRTRSRAGGERLRHRNQRDLALLEQLRRAHKSLDAAGHAKIHVTATVYSHALPEDDIAAAQIWKFLMIF